MKKRIVLTLIFLNFAFSHNVVASDNKIEFVEDYQMTLSFEYGDRSGLYSGGIKNGIPEGVGKFVSSNDASISWTYIGEWNDGHFSGLGMTLWDDYAVACGEYKNDYLSYGLTSLSNGQLYIGELYNDTPTNEGAYYISYLPSDIEATESSEPELSNKDNEVLELEQRIETLESENAKLRDELSSSSSVVKESLSNANSADKDTTNSQNDDTYKKQLIKSFIRRRINENYLKTDIDSITINDNFGTDADGDYIALVYLTWNVKNPEETTEEMLRMYSDDLAASLATDYPEVQELAVFWEVPYLTKNTSKWAYEKRSDGMYLVDNIVGW